MISRFLSRLMSEEYAKNQHGLFPLGIKKTELDKKVIYAVRGFHTLLHTVSSASLNLKGTVDLYSVEELRTFTVTILCARGCTKRFFRTCIEAV